MPSAAAQPGYRLVGKMRAKLREAILAGFDKAALDEIFRDNDMFSHNVAIGPDFSTCVNSLIDVAHQEGWLIELCSVLAAARSGNAPVSSAILAVRQSLTGWATRPTQPAVTLLIILLAAKKERQHAGDE